MLAGRLLGSCAGIKTFGKVKVVTGQRERVNGDAGVGKASQIPWVPVICDRPSELPEIETREGSLISPH